MITEELIQQAEKLRWLHSIDLGNGYTSKGLLHHCTEETATKRFGLPEILSGKTVLDIGCGNGYFSFLAEKRGAIVTAIEPNQGGGDNVKGFKLAKEALGSQIKFISTDLQGFLQEPDQSVNDPKYSIVLYYGVLYHVENPIRELTSLAYLTKGYALIETAISPEIEMNGERLPIWQFRHKHENDPTNFFYPNLTGLEAALKYVGFRHVEVLYVMPGNERATIKCYK